MGRKTRISLRTQDHWATRRIREHSCGELVLFAGLSDLGAGEWRLSSTVGSRYQPQSCSPSTSIAQSKAPASLHPICPSCGISVALRKRSCCGKPHTTRTTARQFHATRHIHPTPVRRQPILIPEDILAYQRRKQRFETLTPVTGSAASACLRRSSSRCFWGHSGTTRSLSPSSGSSSRCTATGRRSSCSSSGRTRCGIGTATGKMRLQILVA